MTQATESIPTCAYPGCENRAEPAEPGAPAAAPQYCANPDHNSLGVFRRLRARRKQRKSEREEAKSVGTQNGSSIAPTAADVPEPAPDRAVDAAMQSRAALVHLLERLSADLPGYLEELAVITDSAVAEARIEAITRAAAEQVLVAERRALLAEQAADLAVTELEKAEAQFAAQVDRIRNETADRLATVRAQSSTEIEPEHLRPAVAATPLESAENG
ncbi:hypothetical protein [Nocardia macrotermitis]|uniref:Uncharacterized protein n=1 Tax=Nocardia macrotermitis TaxID=2585198 RepID=A0A7K0D5I9_9NOCA|nr:hypothetical protein [Nocardia macrotermitis]MQY20094.1 hypothetical protein [Nocardia macrotermitis]